MLTRIPSGDWLEIHPGGTGPIVGVFVATVLAQGKVGGISHMFNVAIQFRDRAGIQIGPFEGGKPEAEKVRDGIAEEANKGPSNPVTDIMPTELISALRKMATGTEIKLYAPDATRILRALGIPVIIE